MEPSAVLNPVIQYGFAGMCGILLFILVWLIKRVLDLLESNQLVIQENTQAIRHVDERTENLLKIAGENEKRLLARPCIAEEFK